MTFAIEKQGDDMAKITADRRLYLAADERTLVEAGDPTAAFLLAGQGTDIPAATVDRLGLEVDKDGRVVQVAADEEGADLELVDEAGNATPLEPDEDEGDEEGAVVEAEEGSYDGWPDGYSHVRSGSYYAVFDPDGEQVTSDSPSGKWNGQDAAQEAAWLHAGGE